MGTCTICGLPIILRPSAQARAEKFGGSPSDYTAIFTEHADCTIQKRDRDVRDLMKRKVTPC